MEKDIDLINAYLNNSLSKTERLAFENRLKTDSEFKNIYDEHLAFLKGLERIELKAEITAARKLMRLQKGLKFGFGVILTLVLVVSIWFLVFNKKEAKDELRKALNFETEMVQSFEASSKDSLITVVGKKGTEITFNTEDLEFQSGKKLVDENLKIELIELTNQQELLLANAQTISNDDWLISGGAFHIDIKAKNESLKLKTNKTISVRFPKNTKEGDMQIFYGDRNEKGYLNWNESNIELKNEKQFVIFFKDTFMLDEVRTRAFGGVETYKNVIKIDTLGLLNKKEINERIPEIDEAFSDIFKLNKQKDTIYLYKELLSYFDCYEFKLKSLNDSDRRDFEKLKFRDRVLTNHNQKKLIDNENRKKAFYEAIEISKLGWINIDQYAKYDDLVTITLENNLSFNFNTFAEEAYNSRSTLHETYLIDKENNTLLNIYSGEIEIPNNKSFIILSFSIVDDVFYVCRKAINVSENKTIKLEYKKRNKEQVESLLRL